MKDGDMAKIELSKLKNDLSSLLRGLAKDGKPVSPHAVIAAYRKKYPKGLSEEVALTCVTLITGIASSQDATPNTPQPRRVAERVNLRSIDILVRLTVA